MTRVNIEDARNYKKCAKKSYEVYACIPEKDTLIINKLEQASLYNKLGKKDHFTAKDVHKRNLLEKYANEIRSGAMFLADGEAVCLCGTVGELWLANVERVVDTYTFAEGQLISTEQLKKGWRKLKTRPTFGGATNFACFVPVSQKGQIKTSRAVLNYNDPLVKHGKGDFIVCAALPNGKPNLADKWVLNGEVFATTYTNNGFADCLGARAKNANITINMLPNLTSTDDSVPKNVAVWKNRKFWLGVVSNETGAILDVYTYETAKQHGFDGYFSSKVEEEHSQGRAQWFRVETPNKIIMEHNDNAEKFKKAIRKQISFIYTGRVI